MSLETLKYTNKEITVIWKPKACIHSTICWKGLMEVFNPKEKPWVKINGASTDKIIEQVKKCPSGALSYYFNKELTMASNPGKKAVETTGSTKIDVSPNGPYLITTTCLIVHTDGKEEIKTGTVALCRCGASSTKPYCDGTHRKIGFEG